MSTPADAPAPTRSTSWSANLETEAYADDPSLVVDHAIIAVERTAPGAHVNLVTHEAHGHPADYLHRPLRAAFDDAEVGFVDRCGCGGYVTRVVR